MDIQQTRFQWIGLLAFVFIQKYHGFDISVKSKCPCNQTEWEKREKQFPCPEKLQVYTCVLTRNGLLAEVCMNKNEVSSTEEGCPFIDLIPNGVIIVGAPFTPCNVQGCPLKDHLPYFVHELYKYPMCYVPVQRREEMSYPVDFGDICLMQSKDSTSDIDKRTDTGSVAWWMIVIIVLVAVLIFTLVIFITATVRKRRKIQRYKQEVEEISLTSMMEYNNYATGLAWSHFTGYLKLLLPDLQEGIIRSQTFTTEKENTFLKWIMLCPKSARSTNICDDPCITVKEEFKISDASFSVKIYEIKKDKKVKYCCMEYPSALMSLGKHSDILSSASVALEVERFTYYMQTILNHGHNLGCRNKAVSILYDDGNHQEDVTLSSTVLRYLEKETDETAYSDTNVCLLRAHSQAKTGEQRKYTNLLLHLKHIEGQTMMDVGIDNKPITLKALHSCYWIVMFVINDKYLTTAPWLVQTLSNLVQEGKCRVILVTKTGGERLAKCIPWTLSIDMTKEEDAFQKVENVITGQPIPSVSDIPVGDVSFGLTWAFYVNYLQHVTPDLLKRVEKKLNEVDLGRKPFRRSRFFWQIVLHSCTYERSLQTIDSKLSAPLKVEPLTTQLHGQQRIFPANLYQFEAKGIKYLFLGEVFSPCKAMKAMKESELVNMTDKQFKKLRGEMVDQMRTLLETFDTGGTDEIKTKLLDYDDSSKVPLSEYLMRKIEEEERESASAILNDEEKKPLT